MLFLSVGLLAAFPHAAAATTDRNASFTATIVEVPPTGFDLASQPWSQAQPIADFENITTQSPATKNPTTARIVFDRNNVYVAIHAAQTGIPIVRTQSTNNVGFGLDDYVGIGLDTTGNGQTYYFETTPSGVRYQQSAETVKFSPLWNATASVTGGDWDAMLVIPLAILRTQNAPIQTWRFNLVRHIASLNENQTWAYDRLMNDYVPNFSDVRYWPSLAGVKVASRANRPKPRAEIFGLESIGLDRDRYQQATGGFARQGTRHVGLDANVPITSTISFVGALAPDFSNVEIDQQTISPQEFRRGLSEYRPFFSQGADFFIPVGNFAVNGPPNSIFYSPSIGPFDRGTKLEGSFGAQSFGLLNVAGAGFNDSVLGYQHVTSDRGFGYSLQAVSAHHADGNLTAFPAAIDDVTYNFSASNSNRTTGFGEALNYGSERGSVTNTTPRLAYKSENLVSLIKPNYQIFLTYRDIGPKWNPIDGFTSLADIRGPGALVGFSTIPGGASVIKKAGLFFFGDRLLDRSGATHQSDFFMNADVTFKNLIHLNFGPSTSALRLYDGGTSLVGYDGGYRNGVTVPFNSDSVSLGYKDGTPTPYDASLSWGPFETFDGNGSPRSTYVRQYSLSTSRPVGSKFTASAEIDGTLEAFPTTMMTRSAYDGQTLRRFSLGEAFGNESNLSLSLRSINGRGGFGSPGINVSASYHQRFTNAGELFINYGTPAANSTIQRVVVKYVLRFGSGSGT